MYDYIFFFFYSAFTRLRTVDPKDNAASVLLLAIFGHIFLILTEIVSIVGNTALIAFTINNSFTIESATHPPVIGYTPWWSENIGQPLNNALSSGPMSATTQTFQWTETITWK